MQKPTFPDHRKAPASFHFGKQETKLTSPFWWQTLLEDPCAAWGTMKTTFPDYGTTSSGKHYYQLNVICSRNTLFGDEYGAPTAFPQPYEKKVLPWVMENQHVASLGKIWSNTCSHNLVKRYLEIHVSLQLHVIEYRKNATVLSCKKTKNENTQLHITSLKTCLEIIVDVLVNLFVAIHTASENTCFRDYMIVSILLHVQKQHCQQDFPIFWEIFTWGSIWRVGHIHSHK